MNNNGNNNTIPTNISTGGGIRAGMASLGLTPSNGSSNHENSSSTERTTGGGGTNTSGATGNANARMAGRRNRRN